MVPLRGSHRVHGVLTLARRSGRGGFSAEDLDMAAGFANQASVAVELAEARAQQERAAMHDERDRIAADLHDHVIQKLFAAGLSLQSVAVALGDGPAAERVTATVHDLDDTIRQIRTTIFQLHELSRDAPSGVRGRLLDVVADVVPALGFQPVVRFDGLLEHTLSAGLVEDLTAVLREALTNAGRHAGARSVEVDVAADGARLTLDVGDDGVGIAPSGRRSGLATMQRRAERHGGTLSVTPRHPTGTRVSWSVPLRPDVPR